MCASCGNWLVFDDSMRLHKPDRRELNLLVQSKNAHALQRLWVQFMREKKGARTQ